MTQWLLILAHKVEDIDVLGLTTIVGNASVETQVEMP